MNVIASLELIAAQAEKNADQSFHEVLVIDEFPYLVKTNSAFPSILQNAWDEILKGSNVMLILSGSLIGMMLSSECSVKAVLHSE